MLTVKHITISGEETIKEATAVRFAPAPTQAIGPDDISVSYVMYQSPHLADGVEIAVSGGTVFVMNSAGKTVSRYDLGASMIPLGIAAQAAA